MLSHEGGEYVSSGQGYWFAIGSSPGRSKGGENGNVTQQGHLQVTVVTLERLSEGPVRSTMSTGEPSPDQEMEKGCPAVMPE